MDLLINNAENQFLTRGRQTPDRVVAVALRAYESGRDPSFIPGITNRMLAGGYRFLPRRVTVRIAEHNVASHLTSIKCRSSLAADLVAPCEHTRCN